MVRTVEKQKGDTVEMLLSLLETRLDNVVYRLGFAKTRFMARQMVSHGHVKVNDKKMTIPSYQVREDDIIVISDKIQKNPDVVKQLSEKKELAGFIKREGTGGKLIRMPKKDDIDVPFNTQQIIEYYSR